MKQESHITNEVEISIPATIKKAFWDQLTSSVPDGNDNVLPLGVYMLCKQLTDFNEIGIRRVDVRQIRGCVGLNEDFDKLLLPHQQDIRDQWTYSDHRRFYNTALPLTTLLKVKDIYFVLGGQHRIPVGTADNPSSIIARVIEIEAAKEH